MEWRSMELDREGLGLQNRVRDRNPGRTMSSRLLDFGLDAKLAQPLILDGK